MAQCQFDKKRYTIGLYTDIKDAEIAVQAFRSKLHGDFARHI